MIRVSFFFSRILRTPRSTRTDTLCPTTTLFRSTARLSARAHEPRLVALPVAILERGALVGLLAAGGEGELHLRDAALVEVDGQRHQGRPLAPHRTEQPGHPALVQQQLARAAGTMADAARPAILGHVRAEKP